eukprot:7760490-Alexandrium_andersonii.AAC.1
MGSNNMGTSAPLVFLRSEGGRRPRPQRAPFGRLPPPGLPQLAPPARARGGCPEGVGSAAPRGGSGGLRGTAAPR